MPTLAPDKDVPETRTGRLQIAVVVPCYRVSRQLPSVLRAIGPEVSLIYCIDDGCPEGSSCVAEEHARDDPRIRVVTHETNSGVGAAVITGYRHALLDGAEVIVKLDGDGQMDPAEIGKLVAPIARGEADYVKGNRFWQLAGLRQMPWLRLLGNTVLSFLSKLSTGYWNLFDPTNGFTAIHANLVRSLPLDRIAKDYFFESDILFRLNTLRAVVADVPMQARYHDEASSLSPLKAAFQFPACHARNFLKRLFYNYFLRDFSFASINVVAGLSLVLFGAIFGAAQWTKGARLGQFASSGTVMLAALPVIVGVQCLLSFINSDMSNIPRDPIHNKLRRGEE